MVGPDVADLAGNRMDQDGDGAYGEPEDIYHRRITYRAVSWTGGTAPELYADPMEWGIEGPPDHWSFEVHWRGSASLTGDGNPHSGQTHLRMVTGRHDTQQANLTLDLSGQSGSDDLWIDAWARDDGDRWGEALGIYVSGDGETWHRAGSWSLNGSYSRRFVVDVDETALAAGIALDADVHIAFRHHPSSAYPSHRIYLDDVRVATGRPWLNQPPTAIELSSTEVAENRPAESTVGFLSTTDPDEDDSFTYELVPGQGDEDNALFAIQDGALVTGVSFDHEARDGYNVRIRSTDSGELSVDRAFTISVTDVNEPPSAVPDAYATYEDYSLIVEAPGGVLANDSDPDGGYIFEDLRPGTYELAQDGQPAGFLDGDESAGSLGGTVDPTRESNRIGNIAVAAGDPDAPGYRFGEIRPSSVQGRVWEDFNADTRVNFGESGIASVPVHLSGTDDRGAGISLTAATDADGLYRFGDLRPGTYSLQEDQPSGYRDGGEVVGTVDGVQTGTVTADDEISGINLARPDSPAENYNFGERPEPDGPVQDDMTAGIGFWQNRRGRRLITFLNGGPDATQLGDWLATTFPNVYGAESGDHDLSGMTNQEVARFYRGLFRQKGKKKDGGPRKVDAHVMSVALSTYVTNETLAGNVAEDYGFTVSAHGLGNTTYDIGDGGEAFGVEDGAEMAVLDILLAVDERTADGLLGDLNDDASIDRLEAALRTVINDVSDGITH